MKDLHFYNFHPESINDVASRLKGIIETAVDGIITIDDKGVIEFVNPATCKIFGYTVEEILGNNVTMLMDSPHKHNHGEYINRYLRTGERRIIGIGREVQGKKKDGTLFPFWLSVSEVQLENRRIFTGIVHDMTEQKKAEMALTKMNSELEGRIAERTEKLSDVINKLLATNQQLQHEVQERKAAQQALIQLEEELRESLKKERDLSQLKSRFVSMASHEFRTPLSTILSSAGLMLKYNLTEQQDKRERHFEKIKSAVESLTAILNDFLSVSRLEEGRVEVTIENIDFEAFCLDTIEELETILKKGQKIVHQMHPSEITIRADKKILKLILINLISNASKYSEEGQTIFCESTAVGNFFTISIKDEGMGIPEEEQQYLFDRFFRASNAINYKGTGLGLHIVKRYVELLNGTITFESAIDKGSIFTVKLPIGET